QHVVMFGVDAIVVDAVERNRNIGRRVAVVVRVGAGTTVQDVVALVPIQRVAFGVAVEEVVAGPAVELVESGTTVHRVGAIGARQRNGIGAGRIATAEEM